MSRKVKPQHEHRFSLSMLGLLWGNIDEAIKYIGFSISSNISSSLDQNCFPFAAPRCSTVPIPLGAPTNCVITRCCMMTIPTAYSTGTNGCEPSASRAWTQPGGRASVTRAISSSLPSKVRVSRWGARPWWPPTLPMVGWCDYSRYPFRPITPITWSCRKLGSTARRYGRSRIGYSKPRRLRKRSRTPLRPANLW